MMKKPMKNPDYIRRVSPKMTLSGQKTSYLCSNSKDSSQKSNRLPGFPNILNTVIQGKGFYIRLDSTEQTSIPYKDIFGMWRTIHNMVTDYLMQIGVLDQYCRLRYSIAECEQKIISDYPDPQHIHEMHSPIFECLRDRILKYNKQSMPEWIKLFPRELIMLPIFQITESFPFHLNPSTYLMDHLKLADYNAMICFPLHRLITPTTKFSIYGDTTTGKNNLEITMKNQFGNNVTIVIASNTNRTSKYLERVASHLDLIYDMNIYVASCRSLNPENKLLCSFVIENRNHILLPQQQT